MDADQRDEWVAYFALVCPSCGNLRSVCSDPSIDWHPQSDVCWPTATREWAQRKLNERHKDVEPGPDELHPLDGVAVWVSQSEVETDEDFRAVEGGSLVAADLASADALPDEGSD